jgi:hypothetical protein
MTMDFDEALRQAAPPQRGSEPLFTVNLVLNDKIAIPANETHLISTQFWGVKQRELKGAKLRFSLVTYKLIHSAQCESLSTPSDD